MNDRIHYIVKLIEYYVFMTKIPSSFNDFDSISGELWARLIFCALEESRSEQATNLKIAARIVQFPRKVENEPKTPSN